MKSNLNLTAVAFGLLATLPLVSSVDAAVLTLSNTAPTGGPDSISNFTGAATDDVNVNDGDDGGAYVAGDRPAQGQTFTTGANALGYTLDSVTLQHVGYGNTFYDFAASGNFNIRVGSVSGTAFTLLNPTETSASFAGGGAIGSPGTGTSQYVTITFATPITLAASTVYGFDLGASSAGFFETNGTNTNPYAGGTAYNSGANGLGDVIATAQNGDHVFQASLTAVPEPSTLVTAVAAILGGIVLLVQRRRSTKA